MVLARVGRIVFMLAIFAVFMRKSDATTCRTLSIHTPLVATHVGSSVWFGVGDVLKFYCDNSNQTNAPYELKGALKIECQKDGSWSSKIPRCIASACSSVGPSVPNAQLLKPIISGRTNNFGNRIKYKCNLGFKIGSGNSYKTCQKTGHWEGNITCVGVVCSHPNHISNGNVTYQSLVYGSQANYTCHKGYALIGQPTQRCNEDGKWSETPPDCSRLCPPLTNPPNGYIRLRASHVFGSTVEFACNQNYRMRGSRTRTCMSDGRWSGVQPKCVINTCGSPGAFSNGIMMSSLPGYVIGTVVRFNCHSGYKLIGVASTRTCTKDGTWTGTRNPTCKALFCEEPGIITHGNHDNMHRDGRYAYGSSVMYSCDAHYYLLGNATLTCLATDLGTTYWSGLIPNCWTWSQFYKECTRQQGKFKAVHSHPQCLFPATVTTPLSAERKSDKELDTLTIVTASAGSTLGALVILLSVMVFVRRFHRNRRFRNHSIRSQFYSEDDHVTLIATYRGDVHFTLPSYDEAMSQVQRDPPPFESVVQSNGTGPTNNNSALSVLPVTDGSSNPENGSNRDQSSAHAQNETLTDQQINIVNNPMIEDSSRGTALLGQVNNQGECPNNPQENFVRNSVSSEESLDGSDLSSSREVLNLSISEDEQSINESQPLIILNT